MTLSIVNYELVVLSIFKIKSKIKGDTIINDEEDEIYGVEKDHAHPNTIKLFNEDFGDEYYIYTVDAIS